MNERDVQIVFSSTQKQEMTSDKQEQTYPGKRYEENGTQCLSFRETSRDGNEVITTVIVSKDGVMIKRSGGITSEMHFASDETTDFVHESALGRLPFSIHTKELVHSITPSEFSVQIIYDLIHYDAVVSTNTISLVAI